MYKFIYVFDENMAQSLIERGFNLLNYDKEKHMYVFENVPEKLMTFSAKDVVYSDMLTF